jgi:4-hydroxy-tetrahydrodipicolinate reductase
MTKNKESVKVLFYGMGPIGAGIANVVLSKRGMFEVVGAIDIDPNKAGKDLGDFLRVGNKLGVRIQDDADKVLSNVDADVVIHATSSFVKTVKPQIEKILEKGVDVVTTCEELSYPYYSHRNEAHELGSLAKSNRATLFATGVNPGFVMDVLPITLSGVCWDVEHVYVERILDASKRRISFQKKVGLGISEEEFRSKIEKGEIGHIGLTESSAMIADAVGVPIEKITQSISPKVAEVDLETGNFKIPKGSVQGLIQDSVTTAPDGKEFIRMHLEMYAFAENTRDRVEIHGIPGISLEIPQGTPGDIATSAIIVNSIPRVIESEPGLKTAKDLRPAASIPSFSKRSS